MLKRKLIPRRDTAQNWTLANTLLSAGEMGVESDTGLVKYGNGSTLWNDLDYFIPLLPVSLPSFTVTTAPDATLYTGSWIYVTNDVGGPVMAFSDGTNWLRCSDRAIIST